MTKAFSEHRLANGLKVLLKEIHTAPLVSAWVWYRVGSRDEATGSTGISHWCEHMQFKGTPQFPSSVLDRAVSRDGGMWNAFTYFDWTTYFETMPADKIDLGLRIEASRIPATIPTPSVGLSAVTGAASMDRIIVTGWARESMAARPVSDAFNPNQ